MNKSIYLILFFVTLAAGLAWWKFGSKKDEPKKEAVESDKATPQFVAPPAGAGGGGPLSGEVTPRGQQAPAPIPVPQQQPPNQQYVPPQQNPNQDGNQVPPPENYYPPPPPNAYDNPDYQAPTPAPGGSYDPSEIPPPPPNPGFVEPAPPDEEYIPPPPPPPPGTGEGDDY